MLQRSYKFILVGAGFTFFVIFLSQMNNAYLHSELVATKIFYQYSPFTPSPDDYLKSSMLNFSKHWRSYLSIYPSGFVSFYSIWSKLTGDFEVAMRLPLLALAILSLVKLFDLLKNFFSKTESAYYLFLICLSPIWYGLGTKLKPESFSLFLSAISFCFYYEASVKNKKNSYYGLLITNAIWLSLSYFSIIICTIQYLFGLFGRKDEQTRFHKWFLYLLITAFIFNSFVYLLTTGDLSTNLFMIKWEKPELVNLYTVFKLLVTGRIDD
jgi:hypothetical protein